MKNYRLKNCMLSVFFVLKSGFAIAGVMEYIDTSVKPQDDFFKHANGVWLKDAAAQGKICATDGEVLQYKKNIVLRQCESNMVRTLVSSLNVLDEKVIQSQLQQINNITDKSQIPALIAYLKRLGINIFIGVLLQPDSNNAVIPAIMSSSAIPNPYPYIAIFKYNPTDIQSVFASVGENLSLEMANQIINIQKEVDSISGDPRSKSLGVFNDSDLKNHYFQAYFKSVHVSNTVYVQINYLNSLAEVIDKYSLDGLKAYFKYYLLKKYNPALIRTSSDMNSYYLLKAMFKDDLDRLCFKTYIDSNTKKILRIFTNVVRAYDKGIDSNWMAPETKEKAREKLHKMKIVIGYRPGGIDYSSLALSLTDPIGNLIKINDFQYREQVLNRFGKPFNYQELTNMYLAEFDGRMGFFQERNTIRLPVSQMFNPYFYPDGEDAINYGSLGMFMSHEISHAYDMTGIQFNADGKKDDWTTAEDKKNLIARNEKIVEQYKAYYNPKASIEKTTMENAADILGLRTAFDAYHLAMEGKPKPAIAIIQTRDGKQIITTGDQRFFYSFAEAFRGNEPCEEQSIYPTWEIRVNGALKNNSNQGFYKAFGVEPGDGMYLAPKDRIRVW